MFDKLKMLSGPTGWGGRSGWYAGATLTASGELLLTTREKHSGGRVKVAAMVRFQHECARARVQGHLLSFASLSAPLIVTLSNGFTLVGLLGIMNN